MRQRIYTIIALIISFLAIVLSQFRPIYNIFDKPVIKTKYASNIKINHYYGFLNISEYVNFQNTGKTSGNIEKMYLFMRKKDDPSFSQILEGKYFIFAALNPFSKDYLYPLIDINIRDNEILDYNIQFSGTIPRKNYELIEEIRQLTYEQINVADKEGKFNSQISDKLFNIISDLTERNLSIFTLGEYYILFVCVQKNPLPEIISAYSFTLYEYDITRLKQITNEYKNGNEFGNLLSNSPLTKGFDVPISLIEDSSLIDVLYNDFKERVQNELLK
jgi:hypothetical protein